jgi:dihydroorotase
MNTCDLVLLDALFPDGRRADISFDKGRVVHVGAAYRAEETVHCRGLLVLPAATDMHVHMRGGPQSAKEDWYSGTMSAIAGGVTLVVDQPNTIPPVTTTSRFHERVEEARLQAVCNFAINAGCIPGSDLNALNESGAMAFGEIFASPSSYGEGVSREDLARGLRTISNFNGLATIHAETVSGDNPPDLKTHNLYRNPEGEAGAVRNILRIDTNNCRLHFCHMSTEAAVKEVTGLERQDNSAHANGKCSAWDAPRFSFEVTPHHLLLSYEDFQPSDTHVKMNPPIRTRKEQRRLLDLWDLIDVIASDHAPHTRAEKEVPFPDAQSGIPGVETMMPLLLAEVKSRGFSLQSLIDKTSTRPCRILGVPETGTGPGQRADFALYPSDPVPVNPDSLHSRAGWTPFEGYPAIFPGIVVMGGRIVLNRGEFFEGRPAWYPGRGYRGPLPG